MPRSHLLLPLVALLAACDDTADDAKVTDPIAADVAELQSSAASAEDLTELETGVYQTLSDLSDTVDAIDLAQTEQDGRLDTNEAAIAALEATVEDLEARLILEEKAVTWTTLVYTTASDCSPNRGGGDYLPAAATCTREQTGYYTVSYPAGTFEDRPICTATITSSLAEGGPRQATVASFAEDAVSVLIWESGSHSDHAFVLTCSARLY